jgi:hypothetical protein
MSNRKCHPLGAVYYDLGNLNIVENFTQLTGNIQGQVDPSVNRPQRGHK